MKDLPCWEVMNCHDEACVARKEPERNCWELVLELEDYRAEFAICRDCLVYVLKNGLLGLSAGEMEAISSGRCALARR